MIGSEQAPGSSAAGVDRLLDKSVIQLLIKINDTRKFSRAAEELGVSQPAISQQVKKLETHLGRRLFHRTRRGVELTRDGEAVILYASAISGLTRELRSRLETTGRTEEVTIGMSEDLLRTALPRVLSLFMDDHSNTRVRVISGTYEVLSHGLDTHTIDFAAMRRYHRFPEAQLLWRDHVEWIGRPGLQLYSGQVLPLVLPLAPNPARDSILDRLEASGRTWTIRFEGLSLAGVEAALQSGLGICARPRSMYMSGITPVAEPHDLPTMADVEFVIVTTKPQLTHVAAAFREVLIGAARSNFRVPDRGGGMSALA